MKKYIIKSKEIRHNAAEYVKHLPGEPVYEVIVQEHVEDKTADQRAFWHVLIGILAKESGNTPKAMKEWVKAEILGTEIVDFGGKQREVIASSEECKKGEYSDLIEHTYRIAAEAGIVLPNPRYRE